MSEWTPKRGLRFWERGRLYLAWRLLRGDSIAYRLTIRDGVLDMRGTPSFQIHDVTVINSQIEAAFGDAALRVALPDGEYGPG